MIQCPSCTRNFFHVQALQNHQQRAHNVTHPFCCNQCSSKFQFHSNLAYHSTWHEEGSKCEFCGVNYRDLADHNREPCCQRAYEASDHYDASAENDLAEPIEQVDIEDEDAEEAPVDDVASDHDRDEAYVATVSCDICGVRLKNKRDLHQHIANNHKKTFACEVLNCNYSTFSEKVLKLHIQIHEGIDYTCPNCDKIFPSASSLKSHLRKVHDCKGQEAKSVMLRVKRTRREDGVELDAPACAPAPVQPQARGVRQSRRLRNRRGFKEEEAAEGIARKPVEEVDEMAEDIEVEQIDELVEGNVMPPVAEEVAAVYEAAPIEEVDEMAEDDDVEPSNDNMSPTKPSPAQQEVEDATQLIEFNNLANVDNFEFDNVSSTSEITTLDNQDGEDTEIFPKSSKIDGELLEHAEAAPEIPGIALKLDDVPEDSIHRKEQESSKPELIIVEAPRLAKRVAHQDQSMEPAKKMAKVSSEDEDIIFIGESCGSSRIPNTKLVQPEAPPVQPPVNSGLVNYQYIVEGTSVIRWLPIFSLMFFKNLWESQQLGRKNFTDTVFYSILDIVHSFYRPEKLPQLDYLKMENLPLYGEKQSSQCFMNAISNMLFSCKEFRDTVLTKEGDEKWSILTSIFSGNMNSGRLWRYTLPSQFHTGEQDIRTVFQMLLENLRSASFPLTMLQCYSITEKTCQKCQKVTPRASNNQVRENSFFKVFNGSFHNSLLHKDNFGSVTLPSPCTENGGACGGQVVSSKTIKCTGNYHLMHFEYLQSPATSSGPQKFITDLDFNSTVTMFGSRWQIRSVAQRTENEDGGGHFVTWARVENRFVYVNDDKAKEMKFTFSKMDVKVILWEKI